MMKTITITIEGMMCQHCETRVQNAVMALDGVDVYKRQEVI